MWFFVGKPTAIVKPCTPKITNELQVDCGSRSRDGYSQFKEPKDTKEIDIDISEPILKETCDNIHGGEDHISNTAETIRDNEMESFTSSDNEKEIEVLKTENIKGVNSSHQPIIEESQGT